MKNLNSKLFKNNTVSKNNMTKVMGGHFVTTGEPGSRDIIIDGILYATIDSIDNYVKDDCHCYVVG
jgi:hypothetical protein